VQSELRKRILKRFQEEGIEMPFPTRTIVLNRDALSALSGKQMKEQDQNSGSGDEGNSGSHDEPTAALKQAQKAK
jgi:small-conductance mechanosensitive channel